MIVLVVLVTLGWAVVVLTVVLVVATGGSPSASTQYDRPVTKLPQVEVMDGF